MKSEVAALIAAGQRQVDSGQPPGGQCVFGACQRLVLIVQWDARAGHLAPHSGEVYATLILKRRQSGQEKSEPAN